MSDIPTDPDSNEFLKVICETIRTHAEETHCPSEVMGVEQWIQNRRKARYAEENKVSGVSSRFADIVRTGSHDDFDNAEQAIIKQISKDSISSPDENERGYYRKETSKVVNEQTRSLRFKTVYQDIESESAQIIEVSEYEWYVVLPKKLQDTMNGLIEPTESMVKAKDELRLLTLHELAHVIIKKYWSNEGHEALSKEKEHEYASILAEMMLEKKMQRNEMIRKAQKAYPESQLNKFTSNED